MELCERFPLLVRHRGAIHLSEREREASTDVKATSKLPLLAALLTVLIAAPARAATPAEIAQTEQTLFAESRSAGMVIVIVRGRDVSIHGYGQSSPDVGSPPTATSLFRIGSVSELFSDDLMVDLRHDRRLTLTDDLARYDPLAALGPVARPAPISLLSLATHTSGVPRSAPGNARAGPDPEGARWRWMRAHPVLPAPGHYAIYSNFAYDLLGDALAAAGGAPYETLVQSRVIAPLGMVDTTFAPTPAQCARLMQGYGARGDFPCVPEHAVAASGGLYSTGADMAAYIRWRLGLAGPPDPDRAIRDGVYVRREELALAEGLDVGGPASGIGLGWIALAEPDGAPQILEKTGGFEGFMSYVALVPGRGVGVFIVCSRLDLPTLTRMAARVNGLVSTLAATPQAGL